MPETFGFYVMVFLFAFVVVLTVITYFTGTFINVLPNPFSAGSYGNSIYQNDTLGKQSYNVAFNTINDGIVIAVILALAMDGYLAWHDPDKTLGIVGILMVFIMPFIWLVFKYVISHLGFMNSYIASTGITPVAYNLFSSTYFIVVLEVFIIISTILNFRHADSPAGFAPADIRSSGDTR